MISYVVTFYETNMLQLNFNCKYCNIFLHPRRRIALYKRIKCRTAPSFKLSARTSDKTGRLLPVGQFALVHSVFSGSSTNRPLYLYYHRRQQEIPNVYKAE